MATRWWLGTTSADAADVNNWSATEGGAGGASVPIDGDTVYLSALNNNNLTLSVNMACTNFATDDAITGSTNGSYYGIITIGNLKLTVSGTMTLQGNATSPDTSKCRLVIGATGELSCVTFNIVDLTVQLDMTKTSILTCNGNWTWPNGAFFKTNNTGAMTMTVSNTFTNSSGSNFFEDFTLNAGCTLTPGADNLRLTNSNSNNTVINGIIYHANGYLIRVGTDAAGSFTFGANSDITSPAGQTYLGAAGEFLNQIGSTNFTNNKVGAFSFRGIWAIAPRGSFTLYAFPLNMPEASIETRDRVGGGAATVIFRAGTYYFSRFRHREAADTTTMDMATNNPNFVLNCDYDLTVGVGLTYNKGTGTITFIGGCATLSHVIKPDAQNIEKIIINAAGYNWTTNATFTCTALTMTAGTLKLTSGLTMSITNFDATGGTLSSDVAGTRANILLTNTAATGVTGLTMKDINWSAAAKVNCKTGCTSLGNNLGAVFTNAGQIML